MSSQAEILLAEQLRQAGIPFESEYRFAPEDWCRANGFVTPTGRPKKWRSDFKINVYEKHYEQPILIEVDGGTWLPKGRHTTGSGFEEDCIKLNAAAELGYHVLRFTTGMVNDGSALAQIRRILSLKEDNLDAA